MKNTNQAEASELRQRAEEQLRLKLKKPGAKLSSTEVQKLIYELEIHQVELEMQNQELVEAKNQALEVSEKYTNLYDFAPAGYYTLSPRGEILELNIAGAKMLGKDRSELKNKLFSLFISTDSHLIFSRFIEKVFTGNGKESCEVALSTKAVSRTYAYLEGIVCVNEECCFLTAIDITEHKLLESKLIESKTLLEEVELTGGIGGWTFDVETLTQNWTRETFEILEIDTAKGEPEVPEGIEFIDQPYRNLAEHAIQRAIEFGEPYEQEWLITTAKGNKRWVNSTGKARTDHGRTISLYGSFQDITLRKRAELELIIAKERAEESDRLKTAFLCNMSHEIRTPMNGILGFAELLKEPGLSSDQQQEYIRIIEKGGARMLNIINDIVDISKIESGIMKVSVKETNVNQHLEYVFKFLQNEAEKKGLQLSYKKVVPATETIFFTDSEKLYAILTNLVKNAIKFTDKGSIEFGCGIVKKGHALSLLQFYVKDSGIGISKDSQEAIFERFIQADIVDKMARQGAGLGLSIAKAYIEMLDGKIWVESEVGKGSTFYFTLPYLTQSKEEITALHVVSTTNEETLTKKLKILIVEDDESSSQLISIGIRKFAAEIINVTSGTEAVEVCRNHPDIDLVLMDIQLPEMDGYEATRQIRKFNKDVVIIAQTAFGLSGDREKAIESGCNDYISKPIKKDELLSLTQKYFKKQTDG